MAEADPYREAVLRVQRALLADRCTLYLVDHERQEVASKVALGLEIPEIRLPLNRGLVGYVARTGKTVNLRDAYNDPRFDRSVDQRTGYRTKTILTMAVHDDARHVAGVLQALNKRAGLFTEGDEEAMQLGCDEVAQLLAREAHA